MEGDDEEQEVEEEEPARAQRKKRLTKSDLYKAYSGRGPIRMFYDLFHDRQLQLEAICMCEIGRPLEAFYAKSLEDQQQHPLLWAASRAWAEEGSWWETCLEVLQKSQEPRDCFHS